MDAIEIFPQKYNTGFCAKRKISRGCFKLQNQKDVLLFITDQSTVNFLFITDVLSKIKKRKKKKKYNGNIYLKIKNHLNTTICFGHRIYVKQNPSTKRCSIISNNNTSFLFQALFFHLFFCVFFFSFLCWGYRKKNFFSYFLNRQNKVLIMT